MKQAVIGIFVIVFLGGLSSCVSMRVPSAGAKYNAKSPASRQAKLAEIHAWQTSGALSVQFNKKADIANYTWHQFANGDSQIDISSALNLYQLQLKSQDGAVSLQKNDGKIITAKTPEALLKKAVGWYLPITPLRFWYKGMPAPKSFGAYKASYDKYGHLVGLIQSGWKITFGAYKKVGGVDLPQLLKINRTALAIKIITRQWLLKN